MHGRVTRIVVSLVTLAVVVTVLSTLTVCHDRAFVDRHTGSRKGFREWWFGLRTGEWHRQSLLERRVRANRRPPPTSDWVSYAGTGRNLLGRPMESGHGIPGPIILVSPEMLDEYCRTHDDAELLALHDTPVRDDSAEVQEEIGRILDWSIQETE